MFFENLFKAKAEVKAYDPTNFYEKYKSKPIGLMLLKESDKLINRNLAFLNKVGMNEKRDMLFLKYSNQPDSKILMQSFHIVLWNYTTDALESATTKKPFDIDDIDAIDGIFSIYNAFYLITSIFLLCFLKNDEIELDEVVSTFGMNTYYEMIYNLKKVTNIDPHLLKVYEKSRHYFHNIVTKTQNNEECKKAYEALFLYTQGYFLYKAGLIGKPFDGEENDHLKKIGRLYVHILNLTLI